MKLFLILLLGLGILVGAIVLNFISSRFGLLNWYEFFREPGSASFFSYVWLFVIYPLGLGVIAYAVTKYLPGLFD